uniref:Uncharacterized protein n=1 Tax=Gopherus agassizii TaxID=38772 RepID=A0A452I6P6_9SAUR
MERSVSSVELCNLAYAGQLEELQDRLREDRGLATRTDQVRLGALSWAATKGPCEHLLSLSVTLQMKQTALSPVNRNKHLYWQCSCVSCFCCSHLACDEERVDEAKLLVSHGASIYIENKEEKTPLKVSKGGLGTVLKRLVEG